MIRAAPAQQGEIADFLRTRTEQAMLPLATLDTYGMDGGHPRSLDVWIDRNAQGVITDVVTFNAATGMVHPQCPNAPWDAIAAALRGREVAVIVGEGAQVSGLLAACKMTDATYHIDRDESFMTLSFDTLRVPAGQGEIVPLADAPRGAMMEWRAAYLQETLLLTPNMSRIKALEDYERLSAEGSHVVLMHGPSALAMSGFNAKQPGVVQIGGVYTPPALRGMGYARRIVALHLQQAARAGVQRAVLSAANPYAVRAYEAIGFRKTGVWRLCLLEPPVPL